MPTEYVVAPGSDTEVQIPKDNYFGELYLIADPPEDYRIRIQFDIPDNIQLDHHKRFVVAYMINPTDGANMPYQIWLNGTSIKHGHPIGGISRGMWEVVGSDLLRELPQHNTIEFWALPNHESRGFLNFSDIVIWFKSI